ncbi:hypothetical protein AAFF_G00023880 [Aldrovandia affinis]|uniref:MARVEL domain-containing protein n=1 Tax=Aldrovandia affinis TaxID=143900 RepID=A0AAD7T5T5_9TELE|nr:hypothetical protein AAFF_G00023880 [Aldrovandia affinis]
MLAPALPLRPRLLPGPVRRVGRQLQLPERAGGHAAGRPPGVDRRPHGADGPDGPDLQRAGGGLQPALRLHEVVGGAAAHPRLRGAAAGRGCLRLRLRVRPQGQRVVQHVWVLPATDIRGLGGQGMAGVGSGSYYNGPKTPFILVVAGLAWVVTVILLVLGMTMYYRTILLDSNWWPLTEFIMNLALAVLYMAAGIMYVRDTTRGGLCSYPVFNNGINGAFCRVEAGQTAAIIFLFATMLVYLIGAIVSLKLWRHEATRRLREAMEVEMKTTSTSVPRSLSVPDVRALESAQAMSQPPPSIMMQPEILSGHIPSGHIPKPVIMPDYVAKYPTIRTDDERDQYKAVFNDQYAEYKELHADVQAVLKRFDEMDGMMRGLPSHPTSQMERDRIHSVLQEYKRRKTDPTFMEKRERCDYLKSKLSHIKQKIQEYNKVMDWNDGYSLDGLGHS